MIGCDAKVSNLAPASENLTGAIEMANENVKEFTDQNFEEEVVKSQQPVLVDFWAEWCPPCRALTPTIEKLANDYAGKVKVGKVDTEAARNVATKYNIQSIPTMFIFKDGEIAQRFVGLRRETEKELRAALDSAIG
jgi:thioredoxin 1